MHDVTIPAAPFGLQPSNPMGCSPSLHSSAPSATHRPLGETSLPDESQLIHHLPSPLSSPLTTLVHSDDLGTASLAGRPASALFGCNCQAVLEACQHRLHLPATARNDTLGQRRLEHIAVYRARLEPLQPAVGSWTGRRFCLELRSTTLQLTPSGSFVSVRAVHLRLSILAA